MEQKQIVYDQIPPLSADHQWIVAQNLDAEDEPEVQIFYSVHDPLRHYRCQIPQLLGKRVRGCFYGWVILSDHPRNVKWSLWNPVTSKVINLPRVIYKHSGFDDNDDDDIECCCLTSPPDDPNSVLLMTRAQKPHFVFCRLHQKIRKLRWTEMSYAKQVNKVTGEDGFLRTLTCCNGKVYASALDSFLVVELSIMVRDTGVVINLSSFLKFPDLSLNVPTRYFYLVGTCKGLFIIYLDFDKVTETICDVKLFKLDMNSKTWEELEDLKNATIFLDIDGYLYPVFHSLAIGSELGGYIHFLSENGGIIYSYHVKDKTISLSYVPCFVGTSHVSTWAMLECKRLLEGDHKQEEDKKDKMVVSKVKSHEVELVGSIDESHLLVPGSSNANLLKREGFTWFESVWRCVQTPNWWKGHLRMEQKQILYDQIPPLSADHQWIVAQNLDAEDEPEVQIFYSVHDPLRHYRCQIPQLLGKHVLGCFYGWVILSDYPHNVKWSLWNPVTSKVIHFPRLTYKQSDSDDDDDIDYYCLTSPPDDPNSVFLMTRTQKPHFVFCRLHPKKKKRWTEISYAEQVKKVTGEDGFLKTLTCCNGKVYAYALGSFLVVELSIVVRDSGVVINLSSLLTVPNLRPNGYMWYCYLVASCKDLLIIYVGFDKVTGTICDVKLFKIDMNSKTWEELEDLKDATIFLNIDRYLYPEFHSLAIGSELGGYIHFLSEDMNIIYSYHVKDKTISLSYVPCLEGTSHVSTWAMLECKRLLEGDHKQEEDKKDKMVVPVSSNANLLKREGFTWFEYVWRWVQTPWIIRLMWLKPWLPKKKIVNSDEVEFIGTTDESHLLNLPFEVLEMIIGFCVGVEYVKFRASCKLCYLAAPIIQWSNKTASKRLELQQYSLVSPWLMVYGKHTLTLFDPIFGDKYFIKTPHELGLIDELKIHCSRYGWLLMRNYEEGLFFFNPFTSDTRKLPFVRYLDSFDFSAPPTSPDCVVFGFCEGPLVYIHFVGESSWREYPSGFDNNDPDLYSFPAFYGGVDVYALRNGKGVDIFEVEDNNCFWTRVLDDVPISSSTSKAQHYLVKCNHEYRCDQPLLLVVVGEFGESIEVFILNEVARYWEEIGYIGRHMIYIGDKTCLCMEAKTPKMENKIYFQRLHNEKVVFYSLETRKFHTFDGGNISDSFTDFSGTKNHVPHNAWIEPAWS